MTHGIDASSEVRVGEIEASGFESTLDFSEIVWCADFAKTDNVRRMAGQKLDHGLFLPFGLGLTFGRLSIDAAFGR